MHLAVDMWHWNNPTHFIFKQTKNVKYIFFLTEDKGNWFLEQKNSLWFRRRSTFCLPRWLIVSICKNYQ